MIMSFLILSLVVRFIAISVALWDFVYVQEMVFRFDLVESLGLLVILAGFSMRNIARKTLGNYFLDGIKFLPRHKLVKHGVYRYIRHPVYLGSILLNVGIILLFSSPLGFLVMLGYIPCVLYRIQIEEKMLIERFGQEYRDYIKKTKKIIPMIY